MKQALGICLAGALAAILEISPLLGASPSSTPSPFPGKATPGVTITPVPDDRVSATGEVEARSNHSFLPPLGHFARDSILRPKTPFEMVPGKDPNGWSFSLEPYAWAMGLDGEVDVRGLPAVDVNLSAKKLLQNLDWAIFGRGEIRKGRWGILGDGFYAELSGSGDMRGALYKSASLNVQQGLASLALTALLMTGAASWISMRERATTILASAWTQASTHPGFSKSVTTSRSASPTRLAPGCRAQWMQRCRTCERNLPRRLPSCSRMFGQQKTSCKRMFRLRKAPCRRMFAPRKRSWERMFATELPQVWNLISGPDCAEI